MPADGRERQGWSPCSNDSAAPTISAAHQFHQPRHWPLGRPTQKTWFFGLKLENIYEIRLKQPFFAEMLQF
jgi:hypothetical protein